MTDTNDHEQTSIPARRMPPKDHLRRAALAEIASDAERYHLTGAIAESLTRCEEHLALLITVHGQVAGALVRIAAGIDALVAAQERRAP